MRRMTPVLSLVRMNLPLLRAVMLGPRWQRAFDVQRVVVRRRRGCVRRRDHVLVVDLTPDVIERVVEYVRDEVPAMWSDPRERLGLSRRVR